MRAVFLRAPAAAVSFLSSSSMRRRMSVAMLSPSRFAFALRRAIMRGETRNDRMVVSSPGVSGFCGMRSVYASGAARASAGGRKCASFTNAGGRSGRSSGSQTEEEWNGEVKRKRRPPPSVEARFGRRPKVGDCVEILVAEKPFQKGDRGIVESVGTLAVTIRVESNRPDAASDLVRGEPQGPAADHRLAGC